MIPPELDHLVYAGPDLAAAVADVERRFGIRLTPGGRHPDRGTKNALCALGPGMYLEVIGPDPEAPAPAQPRPFGIDALGAPRLVTWAARVSDLETRIAAAHAQGHDPGAIHAGGRVTTDGTRLAWRVTARTDASEDGGLVPFLIDWGSTPHPSANAAPGCRIAGLAGLHPEPDRVRDSLRAIGVALAVEPGPAPALVAVLETPAGRVELR